MNLDLHGSKFYTVSNSFTTFQNLTYLYSEKLSKSSPFPKDLLIIKYTLDINIHIFCQRVGYLYFAILETAFIWVSERWKVKINLKSPKLKSSPVGESSSKSQKSNVVDKD